VAKEELWELSFTDSNSLSAQILSNLLDCRGDPDEGFLSNTNYDPLQVIVYIQ